MTLARRLLRSSRHRCSRCWPGVYLDRNSRRSSAKRFVAHTQIRSLTALADIDRSFLTMP